MNLEKNCESINNNMKHSKKLILTYAEQEIQDLIEDFTMLDRCEKKIINGMISKLIYNKNL